MLRHVHQIDNRLKKNQKQKKKEKEREKRREKLVGGREGPGGGDPGQRK